MTSQTLQKKQNLKRVSKVLSDSCMRLKPLNSKKDVELNSFEFISKDSLSSITKFER